MHKFGYWLMLSLISIMGRHVYGYCVNLGTQTTHLLPPDIIINLMKDNGFTKVKLFEADPDILDALGGSDIQVMVGIPNYMLSTLANDAKAAQQWVSKNVSDYRTTKKVDIRMVFVGNEPLLTSYNNSYTNFTLPALQNVYAAIEKAGLADAVKVSIPHNGDIYSSTTGKPSGGDFRSDIRDLLISSLQFLNKTGAPLSVNIYPFYGLKSDGNFPVDYAFFERNVTSPVVDGDNTYTNSFEAGYDTLVAALQKNGFPSLPILIGEIGWPSDGDPSANLKWAHRFNKGIINRINDGQGTPRRNQPLNVCLFSLLDEDDKGIEPGNFERHWGIFYQDGSTKYSLDLGNGTKLTGAKGVKYLTRQWCILAPTAKESDPDVVKTADYACKNADCSSIGNGSSCGDLDARANVSYAFNRYYQTHNQESGTCIFSNLAVVTKTDPTPQNSTCRFDIAIDGATNTAKTKSVSGIHNNNNEEDGDDDDDDHDHTDDNTNESERANSRMSFGILCGVMMALIVLAS